MAPDSPEQTPQPKSPKSSDDKGVPYFEMIEKALSELKQTGRSPSLDRWAGATLAKLGELEKDAINAKQKAEVKKVTAGFAKSKELVEFLHAVRSRK